MKHLLIGLLGLLTACGASQSDKPAATPIPTGEQIELLMPDTTGGLTVNEALQLRTSSRQYAAEPLSLEQLSETVWAAAGINRPESDRLTAPSALALYPIRVYAVLENGIYRYDAKAHLLERVAAGDYRRLSAMQEFAYEAPLNLLYVADTQVYEGRNIPTEKVRYLCGQDAAGYAENVNLYAAGHGLKAITRGSCREAEILALLELDPERYFVALAQTVGR